jgi:hypothetical protein
VAWLRYKGLGENKPKLDIRNRDFLAALKYALASGALDGGPTGSGSAKPVQIAKGPVNIRERAKTAADKPAVAKSYLTKYRRNGRIRNGQSNDNDW